MALIKCPECGREISDKAEICIGCGFPIHGYQEEKQNDDEENIVSGIVDRFPGRIEGIKAIMREMNLEYQKALYLYNVEIEKRKKLRKEKLENEVFSSFNGIYKYTLFGGKQEVYCPRCGSENCAHYQEQKIIPGKTKTRYTANLNPLKPFTLVNKKEKVVRKDQIITESKFICNNCGKIFE